MTCRPGPGRRVSNSMGFCALLSKHVQTHPVKIAVLRTGLEFKHVSDALMLLVLNCHGCLVMHRRTGSSSSQGSAWSKSEANAIQNSAMSSRSLGIPDLPHMGSNDILTTGAESVMSEFDRMSEMGSMDLEGVRRIRQVHAFAGCAQSLLFVLDALNA